MELSQLTSGIMRATSRFLVSLSALVLTKLQQELAEEVCGYAKPNEVVYRLLWGNTIEAEQHVEEINRGMFIPLHQNSHEQDSA